MSALAYLARRFVAGEEMSDAVSAVQDLNSRGIIATLDVLGENVTTEKEARDAGEAYIALLNEIHRCGVQSNVSLKLTQMGLDVSSDLCWQVVQRIVFKAAECKNFVRIDMEGSPYTQRTIDIFQKLYSQNRNVGIVLQAYLHRSEKDAEAMAHIQAPVRVCKGAYKESSSIAFQSMDDIRSNYKLMVEILIRGGSRVGIATHDESLIRWALEWTKANHVSREQFEFQMLYGLKRRRGRELAKMGYTVRSYVPFGTHWFPYFVRRLRERKENVFFVLKSLVAD